MQIDVQGYGIAHYIALPSGVGTGHTVDVGVPIAKPHQMTSLVCRSPVTSIRVPSSRITANAKHKASSLDARGTNSDLVRRLATDVNTGRKFDATLAYVPALLIPMLVYRSLPSGCQCGCRVLPLQRDGDLDIHVLAGSDYGRIKTCRIKSTNWIPSNICVKVDS
ncbi:hypothetical protein [Ralstonia solanacearum]|uniref:hypothetical protein n=1 Tax=Ralstonia solanacearum TaxID=305 RepID=UPI0012FD8F10|nr:hypothetical protein [Ralstonia solanacearum]